MARPKREVFFIGVECKECGSRRCVGDDGKLKDSPNAWMTFPKRSYAELELKEIKSTVGDVKVTVLES